MLRSILLISLLAAPQGPAASHGTGLSAGTDGMMPGSVILLPRGSYAIVVEKATQSLFLYEGTPQGVPALAEVIPANTGEKDGDKQYEGDMRTPEGVYFFTGVIDGSELPAEYGVRAFVTDYPNIFDRLAGKYGSNIWLHATNEPARVANGYNTRGCVVVTNENLNRLTPLIRTDPYTGSTALVVENSSRRFEPERAGSIREEMVKLVSDWEEAWESMDIERYMALFSRRFSSRGMNYGAYRSYKARLTRQYQYIKVDVSNLHIFAHDGEVVAQFNQRYESDRYLAQSSKRLYFKNEPDGWKIVAESSWLTPLTLPEREPEPEPEREPEPESAEETVRKLVSDWESAWESMEIDRYMAFYSGSFISRGMDYTHYRAYKQRLIDRYSFIRVDISNLQVYPRNGGMIAAFDQRYESDSYLARSSKRLFFELEEGVWKIVRETSESR